MNKRYWEIRKVVSGHSFILIARWRHW